MKITMILPYLKAGGTERQAAYIVNYLKQKEHTVLTISVEDEDFFEPHFKVPVQYLNSQNSFLFLIYNIYSIASIIRKNGTQVLVSRAWSTNLLCTLVSMITGIPNVLFLSASLDMSNHSLIKKLIYRFMLKKTDQIISVSEATKQNCIKWFDIQENKIKVIHNGVDIDHIQKLSKKPVEIPDELKDGTPKLVFVGRLIHRKGLDVLINALMNLKSSYQTQLIVVGEGSKMNDYKIMCKDFEIESMVFFFGQKKNPFPYLNLGDIFILPSRSEGFPNILLEAMALNKTVIAANCKNGPNEIIDKNNGTLVDVDNSEQLSLAISSYLDNLKLAKNHGENAKKTVKNSFKLSDQLAKIEMTITSLKE